MSFSSRVSAIFILHSLLLFSWIWKIRLQITIQSLICVCNFFFLDFIFILCVNWQKLYSTSHISFHTWQLTMPHQKSRIATTYHQCPNALFALDFHTIMSYQCFQALCAVSLVKRCQMLMLSMFLDEDDDNLVIISPFSLLQLIYS